MDIDHLVQLGVTQISKFNLIPDMSHTLVRDNTTQNVAPFVSFRPKDAFEFFTNTTKLEILVTLTSKAFGRNS